MYDLEIEIVKTYHNYNFMDIVMRYNMVDRYYDILKSIGNVI